MNQLRIFLVILASCFLLPADAKGGNAKDVTAVNDSLLRVLDKAVADSKALRERHEERINALRTTYGNTSSWSVRYDIAQQIYKLYYTYKTNMALHYLHLSLSAAEHLRDIDKIDQYKCQLMEQYVRTGFFGEAVLTMNEIGPKTLNAKNRIAYYDCISYMYNQLAYYTKDKTDQDRFRRLEKAMKDSLLRITPPRFHDLANLHARGVFGSRQVPGGTACTGQVGPPHQARRARLCHRGILPLPDIRRNGA